MINSSSMQEYMKSNPISDETRKEMRILAGCRFQDRLIMSKVPFDIDRTRPESRNLPSEFGPKQTQELREYVKNNGYNVRDLDVLPEGVQLLAAALMRYIRIAGVFVDDEFERLFFPVSTHIHIRVGPEGFAASKLLGMYAAQYLQLLFQLTRPPVVITHLCLATEEDALFEVHGEIIVYRGEMTVLDADNAE